MLKRISIVLFSIVLGGCSDDEPTKDGFYIVSYTADFSQSLDNWEVDFADYPAGKDDSVEYALTATVTKMPPSTGNTGTGLLVSGANNSGDLFMFLKRKVSGLNPNTAYTIVFDIQLASNASSDLVDGNAAYSPGRSVYLKVGAVDKKPTKTIQDNFYRINIDKGDQGSSGADMITIGDIGVSPGNLSYTIITRSSSSVDTPIIARTDSNGELWLVVGTESGYQGTTSVYYSRISVVFSVNN